MTNSVSKKLKQLPGQLAAKDKFLIIIKSLFQAMPIKEDVHFTIAQTTAQILGARVHVRIITTLRTHIDVAKKPTYVNINI